MALIYVLEDDESVRELEVYALTGNGYEVEGFSEPAAFYAAVKRKKPDLAVLDIMLPEEDGLSVTKKLRADRRFDDMSIVLVTAKDSEMDYVKGLECGADDYIAKPFSVMIFLSRVKAVLRRTRTGDKREVYQYASVRIDDRRHKVYSFDEEVDLTYKEYEILKYLILNRGIAVTREQLLNAVWGYNSESESRTVDSHMLTLRKKLGRSGLLIETIRNVGYKLGD